MRPPRERFAGARLPRETHRRPHACPPKRQIRRRTVISGVALQVFIAVMILHVKEVHEFFQQLGVIAKKFLEFSWVGVEFVFGPLAKKGVFAFIVFPTVVFVSSFFAVLYYLGILQFVVKVFARAMRYPNISIE